MPHGASNTRAPLPSVRDSDQVLLHCTGERGRKVTGQAHMHARPHEWRNAIAPPSHQSSSSQSSVHGLSPSGDVELSPSLTPFLSSDNLPRPPHPNTCKRKRYVTSNLPLPNPHPLCPTHIGDLVRPPPVGAAQRAGRNQHELLRLAAGPHRPHALATVGQTRLHQGGPTPHSARSGARTPQARRNTRAPEARSGTRALWARLGLRPPR